MLSTRGEIDVSISDHLALLDQNYTGGVSLALAGGNLRLPQVGGIGLLIRDFVWATMPEKRLYVVE